MAQSVGESCYSGGAFGKALTKFFCFAKRAFFDASCLDIFDASHGGFDASRPEYLDFLFFVFPPPTPPALSLPPLGQGEGALI